jgi:WD40 repeat protein/tetratricopeptide (TPR) repeat protein
MVTGRFESPAATATLDASDPDAPTLDVCPDPDAPTAAVPASDACAPPSAPPDDSASSASLAGHTETRYFREVARLGAQVADALAHAHKRGVLHRDIKPSNILLDAAGNAWITDFGLAKFEDGDDLSQSRDLVGTLRYMAPERFRGVSDRRGDVYALGATLYEMLALRPAFTGSDQLRLIQRIIHDPPTPPRQLDRRIPRDLETIVLKAMAKDPKDRFTDAGQMADELRRYVDGRPIHSRPIPAPERLLRWCRRNPVLAGLNVLAATLTIAIAVISSVSSYRLAAQNEALRVEQDHTAENLRRALQAESRVQTALERSTAAERAARLDFGKALLAEGAAVQTTRQAGQGVTSLERLTRAAEVLREHPEGQALLPEIRDHAITALGLTDVRETWSRTFGEIEGFTYSPDLSLLAYGRMRDAPDYPLQPGEATVRRRADDAEILRIPASGLAFWHWSFHFSPDGRFLAVAYAIVDYYDAILDLWDLSTGQRVFREHMPGTRLAFDPTGRWLAYRADGPKIAVWDLRRGLRALEIPMPSVDCYPFFDRSGDLMTVAARQDESSIRVATFEVPSGERSNERTLPVAYAEMGMSPDGRWLAVSVALGRAEVWNLETGRLNAELRGHGKYISNFVFSPVDPALLLTTSYDGTTRFWDPISGESLLVATGMAYGFSPDGRSVGFLEAARIGRWELRHGGILKALNPAEIGNRSKSAPGEAPSWSFTDAEFSANDRLLAVPCWNGTYLYDLGTSRPPALLPDSYTYSATFSEADLSLITGGTNGVFLWPLTPQPDGSLRVGPPRCAREALGRREWYIAARSGDGASVGFIQNQTAEIELLDAAAPRSKLRDWPVLSNGGNRRMTSVAFSPDGRWAAAGGWKEAGISVWDLATRRRERLIQPADSQGDVSFLVSFSPDGRWLASNSSDSQGGDGIYLWRVGTWDRHRRFPVLGGPDLNPPAFRPDGRMLAFRENSRTIALVDPDSGRRLASLRTLEPVSPRPIAFSRSGTLLLATTNDRKLLLWDLARLRAELAEHDLDWDEPPLRASPPFDAPVPTPGPIEVVGRALPIAERRAAELSAADAALAARPNDVAALVERGWLHLVEGRPDDAERDLVHAARLAPDDPDVPSLRLRAALARRSPPTQLREILGDLVARRPDDLARREHLLRVALQLDQFPTALEQADFLVENAADRHVARYLRALALLGLRRHADALSDLDFLIEHHPRAAILHELRADALEATGRPDLARIAHQTARAIIPDDPNELNNQAWDMVAGDPLMRDAPQALLWARKAVELAPSEQMYLNTLGVALYRTGRHDEAADVLRRSLDAGQGQFDAFDLYFLAMAEARRGRPREALECFDRAVAWHDSRTDLSPRYLEELAAFRAEARQILGLDLPDLPERPFASLPTAGDAARGPSTDRPSAVDATPPESRPQ